MKVIEQFLEVEPSVKHLFNAKVKCPCGQTHKTLIEPNVLDVIRVLGGKYGI